jgi:hypothetical protein
MSVLALLLVVLVQMLNAISKTWGDGEKRIENFGNGRAILDLIARELAPAVISNAHQMIQNPFTDAQRSATVPTLAPNSDSLFWQAPLRASPNGDLCEVGYYLTDPGANGKGPYQLKRFFVPQDHAKFLVYATSYTPNSTTARWIASPTGTTFTATEFDNVSSVVSDGVLGFWVRCFDVNGEPIPWFLSNSPEKASAPNTKFNSAARFQPAVVGTAGSITSPWPYTLNTSPITAQANRLPSVIEISIATIDSRTLKRNPTLPTTPTVATPSDLPNVLTTLFNVTLPGNRIDSARLFTTRVRLINGTQ